MPGRFVFKRAFYTNRDLEIIAMNKQATTGGKDAIESTARDGSEVSTSTPRPFVSIQRTMDEGATQVHTFVGTQLEVYRRIAKCSGGGIKGADDLINKSMQLTDYYCHTVELPNNQTGEIVNCIRTVLIDKDGTPYQFVSQGIVSGLDTIRQCFGDGPFNPPVKITVAKTKAARGSVLNIVPVD